MSNFLDYIIDKIHVFKFYLHDLFSGKPTHTEDKELRSGKWRTTRKHHLEIEDCCQWCGGTEDLQVHHIIPFSVDSLRENDQKNLITLCEHKDRMCHFLKGHNGTSWHDYNPNIVEDCQNKNRK